MNFETLEGTFDKITEYIERLKELRNHLTTEIIDTSFGNFDEINASIDSAITKLENIKSDITENLKKMSDIYSYFNESN